MASDDVRRRLGVLLLAVALVGCAGGDEEPAPVSGQAEVKLKAQAVDQRAVRLSWPTSLLGEVRAYAVERRQDLDGAFSRIASVERGAGDSLVYLDTSVEPETFYGYRLRGVDALGELTAPTSVTGVRTPSRPGLRIEVTQSGPADGQDLDGFLVRAEGPDTVAGIVQTTQLFKPIRPGTYRVTLAGIASQCRATDTLRTVEVSDIGVETLRVVSFAVDCRNPNRGDVVALVALTQGEDTTGFTVTLSGRPTPPAGADSIVFLSRRLGATGGAAAFEALRPGRYEVELTAPARCTLQGAALRTVDVLPLSADTLRYELSCGGVGGADGDFQPADPAKPYRINYRWVPAQAATGGTVTLVATLDLTGGPPLQFGALQVTSTFDPALLRATRFTAGAQFNSASNLVTGGVAWVVNVTSPITTPIEVGRITFEVLGASGRTAVTRSTVVSLADLEGNEQPYTAQAQVRLEAPLQIGAGGGTTNQPPQPIIAGPATLTVQSGNPLVLSSTGSTDPDGTIASYAWTMTGGAPAAATGPSTSVTYAQAGNYSVRLTVTDNAGASASVEKPVAVVASSGGGGNQAPVAVIDGGTTLAATAGAPLTLSATGSRDPDGSIAAYGWSLPGAVPASASGASVSATYATAGTYTATLTVTDNGGATATATKSVIVVGGTTPPSGELQLRNAFGAADAQGLVPLTLTLDLSADVPETPGVERIKEFRIDSLAWNAQLLEFVEVRFPSNVSGTFSVNPSFPGRVYLAGRFVGEGPTGAVPLAAVVLRPRAGATGTTTTRTHPGLLQSTAALGSVDYTSRTRLVEATWPATGGLRLGTPMSTVASWPIGAALVR